MATKKKNLAITKVNDIKMDKIKFFFRRSILKDVMRILTMEHSGFRTLKSVKNINKLFTSLDLQKYANNEELKSYIWCICFISKQWLTGITNIELIAEGAKRQPEYDITKEKIINTALADKTVMNTQEVKSLFDLISEVLQFGYIASLKDDYIDLLEDIDIDKPGAFKELVIRLMMISKSLMDIQHNTNLVSNKITFNTSDIESVREALNQTRLSLQSSNNMLKIGIRRLNTLLSPAYMNGRLYIYAGAAGSGKSIILQKTAVDIRKYNPNFEPKTPGMKPYVLYITMENF